ncbi:hypothetical protein [Streptomyces sp. NPDC046805]|uniref:hypothetical protein n=1 Tax=Streptomyces sp. NPDC046805 TaxID=3155134 RepID=UPI003406B36F
MSERPYAKPDAKRKRFDLSVPQVAGTAMAAVAAAKLASYFGVYGTILGAGLVSIIATCGGSVLQHLFRRTGEQIRDAAVTAKPAVPAPPPPGEFTDGIVYRARIASWKRPALAAALVFGLTMGGITVYELVSGDSFSGGKGTTLTNAVTGHNEGPSPKPVGDEPTAPGSTPSPTTSGAPSSTGYGTPSGSAPSSGTPSGSASPSGAPTAGTTSAPAPTDTAGTPTSPPSGSATTPTPSSSSRSGSAAPDRVFPVVP